MATPASIKKPGAKAPAAAPSPTVPAAPHLAVVVRLRGVSGVRATINHTLALHKLTRRYHARLFSPDKHLANVLQPVKNYVAYGEIDEPTLEALLSKRLHRSGKAKIDEAFFKSLSVANAKELAAGLISGKITLFQLTRAGAKPFFALHPPRKGIEGIKYGYPRGALGNWGPNINKLIMAML